MHSNHFLRPSIMYSMFLNEWRGGERDPALSYQYNWVDNLNILESSEIKLDHRWTAKDSDALQPLPAPFYYVCYVSKVS